MESAGDIRPGDAERRWAMATRLTPKEAGGKKPTTKSARPKKAPPEEAVANGPAAPAKARPEPEAKKGPRSRKGTTVNAETAEVLRDAEAGKNLLHYPSLEAMFEDLGI
jgi:hypothetical protein